MFLLTGRAGGRPSRQKHRKRKNNTGGAGRKMMIMQLKVFSIPVVNPDDMEEEANRFLRAHRVMTIDRQFTAVQVSF